jgi:hypothetical protein
MEWSHPGKCDAFEYVHDTAETRQLENAGAKPVVAAAKSVLKSMIHQKVEANRVNWTSLRSINFSVQHKPFSPYP